MKPLTEAAMQSLEAGIPALAQGAFQQARAQALTVHGRIIEAVDGQLVETSAEGLTRVIGSVPAPTRVSLGLKRVRRITLTKPRQA